MAYSSNGNTDIIVWEWEEDIVQWIPYSASISKKLEQEYQYDPNQICTIKLETFPGQKVQYDIDFRAWIQTNRITGNLRRIHRRLVSSSSPFAQGHYWEWCKQSRGGPKQWTSYSVDVSNEIEHCHARGKSIFTLPPYLNMNHEIDLTRKKQTNIITRYERDIRRQRHNDTYPLDGPSAGWLQNGSVQSGGGVYPHFSPLNNVQPPTTHGAYGYNNSQYLSNGHSSSAHGAHGSHSQQSFSPGQNPLTQGVLTQSQSSLPSNHPGSNFAWNVPTNPIGASSPSNPHSSNSSYSTQFPPIPLSSSSSVDPVSSPSSSTSRSQNQGNSNGSSAKKKKSKSDKQYVVSPCPHGGIPCNTAATTGNVPVAQVLQKFARKFDVDASSTDTCAICQSNLTDESGFGNSKDAMELLCQHVFHLECLQAQYSSGVQNGCIVCPSCTKTHGIRTGNQPDGVMRYSKMSSPVPGYSGCGHLRVEYHISAGTQTANHPNPGSMFSTPGFPRIGYLPDNNEGRRVLLLLIEAWKRRLIFTVGQSTTSGMQNCVTWTSIHHKTELHTNRGHGYPDPTYLDRVTAELEAEGVTEDSL